MRDPKAASLDISESVLALMDSLRSDLQGSLPHTCSFMHVKTLGIVDRLSEPSMSQVADELKITSPGATMVVDRLVESGELERMSDPSDRRVIRLKITDSGKKVLKEGVHVVRACIDKRLSKLSKAEQSKLSALLNKII